jgi:GWxTD domain-containing protein
MRLLETWVATPLASAVGWTLLHSLWEGLVICAALAAALWGAQLRLSRPVLLLESCLAEVPMVIGHIRPVILMPIGVLAGLPAGQIEAILLHELAHIRRYDYLVNVVQRWVECLLFYHPAAWWISRVIRAERENCCDDVVVATRGNVQEYAAALATLEQDRWSGRDPAVAASGGSLMKRIRRMLYPQGASGVWTPLFAAAIVIATAVVALAAWPARPPQQKPTNAPPQAGQAEVSPYDRWLNQEVPYIIEDKERAAFKKLATNEERDEFIKAFWERRNPNPGSPENKFKIEHYRRLAYANRHYASSQPGWKTDRGRIYIMYGPPDEIDSHLSGGAYERPTSEGGGKVMTYPYEIWRYAHLKDMSNVILEFVYESSSGEFHMTRDPKEKYKNP